MMFRWFATSRNAPDGSARRGGPAAAGRLAACLLTAAAIAAAPAQAAAGGPDQALPVEVRLETDSVAVGEPFLLSVVVRHDTPLEWESRSVGVRAGPFEIEQVAGPESVPAPGAPEPESGREEPGTRWLFRLAAFELGSLTVPPLRLRYRNPGEEDWLFVETPEQSVEVVTTIAGPEEEPADIRRGFTLPRELGPWLALGTALLAAAAAALLLRRYLRRRARATVPAASGSVPRRPPYERWREALEALLRSGLLESGRIKEFHVRIAEIVKRYLGETLHFDAIDRTTWEVMEDLRAAAAPEPLRSETELFLDACDRVKFAKHLPESGERDRTVESAWKILELVRPQPPEPPAAGVSS